MDTSMILILVGMFALFYFMMIRPENKKRKALDQLRDSLSVGDSITTVGGIMGDIVHLNKDKVTLETSEDRVRVQIARWAVSALNNPKDEVEGEDEIEDENSEIDETDEETEE